MVSEKDRAGVPPGRYRSRSGSETGMLEITVLPNEIRGSGLAEPREINSSEAAPSKHTDA